MYFMTNISDRDIYEIFSTIQDYMIYKVQHSENKMSKCFLKYIFENITEQIREF